MMMMRRLGEGDQGFTLTTGALMNASSVYMYIFFRATNEICHQFKNPMKNRRKSLEKNGSDDTQNKTVEFPNWWLGVYRSTPHR